MMSSTSYHIYYFKSQVHHITSSMMSSSHFKYDVKYIITYSRSQVLTSTMSYFRSILEVKYSLQVCHILEVLEVKYSLQAYHFKHITSIMMYILEAKYSLQVCHILEVLELKYSL